MITGNIIAYSGPHGTGKSTAVYGLARELKIETKGEVGVVLEIPRQCPFPIHGKDSTTTKEAQRWIFAKQMLAELEASRLYNVVVSDRSVADNIAYTALMGWRDLAWAQVKIAKHHVGIYREIRFRGIADNPYCLDDGCRSLDMEERERYEGLLLNIYNDLGIKVIRDRA